MVVKRKPRVSFGGGSGVWKRRKQIDSSGDIPRENLPLKSEESALTSSSIDDEDASPKVWWDDDKCRLVYESASSTNQSDSSDDEVVVVHKEVRRPYPATDNTVLPKTEGHRRPRRAFGKKLTTNSWKQMEPELWSKGTSDEREAGVGEAPLSGTWTAKAKDASTIEPQDDTKHRTTIPTFVLDPTVRHMRRFFRKLDQKDLVVQRHDASSRITRTQRFFRPQSLQEHYQMYYEALQDTTNPLSLKEFARHRDIFLQRQDGGVFYEGFLDD